MTLWSNFLLNRSIKQLYWWPFLRFKNVFDFHSCFFSILCNRIILQFAVLIHSTKTLLIFPITGHAIKQCLDIRIWAYLDIAEEKWRSFIFGVRKTCIDEYKLFALKYAIKDFHLGYLEMLFFHLPQTWTTCHIKKGRKNNSKYKFY